MTISVSGFGGVWLVIVTDSRERPTYLVADYLEACERARAERRHDRNIGRIAAALHQDAADARLVVAGIKRVPAVNEINFEPCWRESTDQAASDRASADRKGVTDGRSASGSWASAADIVGNLVAGTNLHRKPL